MPNPPSPGFTIYCSSIALFIAEVLHKCIREEEAHPELYQFIEGSMLQLDSSPKADSNFHLSFLLRLSRHLGFFPDIYSAGTHDYFDLKEGKFTDALPVHSYFIPQPYSGLLEKLLWGKTEVTMSLSDRNFLLEKVLLYYSLHLHDFRKISSHRVLHEILEGMDV